MKNVRLFLILLLIGASGIGCKKSGNAPPPSWTTGSEVYIVGQDTGKVVYWKNGQRVVLATGGQGTGITVAGTDVYVSGVLYSGSVNEAAYWKNGVKTILWDSSTSMAYQPVVSGGDVYVPGYVFGPSPQVYPVYWKNGQKVSVDPTHRGTATGMAVLGNDIYVNGTTYDSPLPLDTALVWKNGARMNFYSINSSPFSQILSSVQTIYVVGNNGYYVNFNQFVSLPARNPSEMAGAGAMFVSGSDVYVAGAILDSAYVSHPVYWKNGELVELPVYKNAKNTSTCGIAVAGTDVYVVGTDFMNYSYQGVYWKNGVEQTLTNNGYIYGITVGN